MYFSWQVMGGMGDIWTNLNQNEVWILSLWWFKVSDMSNFGLLSLLVGVLLGFLFQSSRSSGHNFKVLKECTILDTNSNPQKSGTLWAYTTFPLITQKLLTTNPFHWLELISLNWELRTLTGSSQLPKNVQFEEDIHLFLSIS